MPDYDEFSYETHPSRQSVYKKMNYSLKETVTELRSIAVKTQEDLDAMTRSSDEAWYEIQRLKMTIRKQESTMETQRETREDITSRTEGIYDYVRAELWESDDEIVARESGIENRDSTILDRRSLTDLINRRARPHSTAL